MTIKGMLRKVHDYNRITAITGGRPVVLMSEVEGCREKVKSYMEFQRYIRETYVEEVAEALLGYGDYEIEAPVTLRAGEHLVEVEFSVY